MSQPRLFRHIDAWDVTLSAQEGKAALRALYAAQSNAQAERYRRTLRGFAAHFGDASPVALISAPGRTELSGNHTDHQHGRVLAAAVTLDVLAAVRTNETETMRIVSEGYGACSASIADLSPRKEERGTTLSLLRGVAAALREKGYALGGFDAYITSDVPQGSGLSSSAALEVLLGTVHNTLFNDGKLPPLELAKAGQLAENAYFGKPCGLMDQAASALGGAHCIDFFDPANPDAKKIPCDFDAHGYSLYIVNAGGSHAGLTEEYAAIPAEMRAVAHCFGADVLRGVDPSAFHESIPALRRQVSDRAVLRAMHFFAENERVAAMAQALHCGDIEAYRTLMLSSGTSSMALLQNIYPAALPEERSVSLALALAADCLGAHGGAWRVHGGGFAGTIQALVPHASTASFRSVFQSAFGAQQCYPLAVRPVGGWALGLPFSA